MKFKALQDNLRHVLWGRIAAKQLTGMRLAQQTGFKQAHISNFLNRKRSLSMEGLDKVLSVQHLSVLDLLDPNEVNKRASILPPSEDDFENVLLVESGVAATHPLVTNETVLEILKFKKNFLNRLRPEMHRQAREEWRRFVLIKVDANEGMSMYPRLLPGATVLIDRHYNTLQPYRKGELNMYAVKMKGTCIVRYVELAGRNLVLRPHNQTYAVEVVPLGEGEGFTDHLVGRVCHMGIEV